MKIVDVDNKIKETLCCIVCQTPAKINNIIVHDCEYEFEGIVNNITKKGNGGPTCLTRPLIRLI